FGVGVQRVGDQVQQLRHFRLEGMGVFTHKVLSSNKNADPVSATPLQLGVEGGISRAAVAIEKRAETKKY
ncbi:MAG: hypothetical protein LC106_00240, partial [Burkholderiales bacterium]|nr:hypothetical protein [Burkholderiales bacterium]